MLNAIFNNPQIMRTLQMLSNSGNPMAQMDTMFGNNPNYQSFKQEIAGKNQQEIIQYFNNKFNEQGINLNNIVNTARQFGLIK